MPDVIRFKEVINNTANKFSKRYHYRNPKDIIEHEEVEYELMKNFTKDLYRIPNKSAIEYENQFFLV
jgi:hypothetical protein